LYQQEQFPNQLVHHQEPMQMEVQQQHDEPSNNEVLGYGQIVEAYAMPTNVEVASTPEEQQEKEAQTCERILYVVHSLVKTEPGMDYNEHATAALIANTAPTFSAMLQDQAHSFI
jgi:hypothetical protein